jgi:hypothetical protein
MDGAGRIWYDLLFCSRNLWSRLSPRERRAASALAPSRPFLPDCSPLGILFGLFRRVHCTPSLERHRPPQCGRRPANPARWGRLKSWRPAFRENPKHIACADQPIDSASGSRVMANDGAAHWRMSDHTSHPRRGTAVKSQSHAQSQGQAAAQREIATSLRNALDARGQRSIVSLSQVNLVKWSCLAVQAICILLAIACAYRQPARLRDRDGIFATGIAVSVLLIAAHDRPFTGQISVGPDPLLQLLPKGNTG